MGKLSDLDDSKRFKSGLLKGYLKQIAKPPSPSSGEFTSFTLLITLLWYTSNISVVILNKFLLSSFNFKKPFVLTLCHMLLSSCLSYFVSTTNVHKVQYVKTRLQFIKICVLALVFVTSVGLGNVSLRYIPVSFNQAIGACTPFFTAILVILIQGKFESKITYVTLVPVVLGIIITTRGEPLFNAIGFMACIGSTSCRALKSVIQSVLLNSESEKMTSMNLLRYMAPIASCALITVVSLTEPQSLGETIDLITTNKAFAGWLLLNSTLAYCQNLLNFLVTKYTSALTLQVLGNAKGVVAAAVSVLIFRNPVTLMGCTGYFVTMLGVVAYSESKKRSKWTEEARHKRTSSELPVTENDAHNGSPGPSSARV